MSPTQPCLRMMMMACRLTGKSPLHWQQERDQGQAQTVGSVPLCGCVAEGTLSSRSLGGCMPRESESGCSRYSRKRAWSPLRTTRHPAR